MSTPDGKKGKPVNIQAKINEYFQSTIINNITIFATMLIIYFFISADKTAAYTYSDTFEFMNLVTNPHPCDNVKKEKDAPANNAKNNAKKDAAPDPAKIFNKSEADPIQAGTKMMSNMMGKLGNQAGGGSVSENLMKTAYSVQGIGNAINSFTTDVKHDIDYKNYMADTLTKYKSTYCNDIDDMSMFGAFFFILHSSFLACYNSIQQVNLAIVKLIYMKSTIMNFDAGVLFIYLLFILVSMTSSSFIKFVTNLIDPSMSSSNTYLFKIIFSTFSAIINLLFVYFIIAIISYFTYLGYGLLNIKSEQSSLTFKLMYAFLIFLPLTILPSTIGVHLI